MARRIVILASGSCAAALLLAPATAQAADPDPGTSPAKQQVTLAVPTRIPVEYLVRSTVSITVTPASYSGKITVATRDGSVLGSASASGGTARLTLDSPTLGRVPLTFSAAATSGFDGATRKSTMVSKGVSLTRGTRHPVVAQLLRLLGKQHYVLPQITSWYGKAVSDVVLAFQKVHDLPRTAEMDAKTWRAFAEAEPVTPRRRGSGTHIEVDKTRQILMLVRDGTVRGTLHVSTGATGNTPEGHFRVYAKGVGSLFRFMPFTGNFGIHGYVPVPPYPASHGCVREPMWAANWTYQRTRIGTPVFIYH